MKISVLVMYGFCALALGGCATSQINNAAGRPTMYSDVTTRDTMVAGVGVESQDIVAVTDTMMRDMLANRMLAGRDTPPRIIIDDTYFRNESTSRINKKMITDRLRILLNRASQGRMVFVGRHFSNMVEQERAMKRDGVVDGGTIRTTRAAAGADYRLGGTISSMDARMASGATSRYHMLTFEMIDLELGTIIWSGMYEFKKSGQDDVVYR